MIEVRKGRNSTSFTRQEKSFGGKTWPVLNDNRFYEKKLMRDSQQMIVGNSVGNSQAPLSIGCKNTLGNRLGEARKREQNIVAAADAGAFQRREGEAGSASSSDAT